ncbi:kinase-like protein [Ceratobasidium sp. AG-I]|nr:kinase-like protein [Ceratobasidium sp. AG-I]
MTALRMFRYLLDNQCTDLTSRIVFCQPGVSAARGRYSDIYHGKLDDTTEVAIKCLRPGVMNGNGEEDHECAMREAYNWSKMKHENVQQLLGIVLVQERLGIVSPWMNNGDLQEYIKNNPDVDRYKLCLDVATGVAYLHSIEMVHGDIKAAPELSPMPPEEDTFGAVRSQEADMYSLGMTMLEIITGRVPYSEFKSDRRVIHAVDYNIKPVRPQELLGPNRRENEMWDLLTKCWDCCPKNRPVAAAALKRLRRLIVDKTLTGRLSDGT